MAYVNFYKGLAADYVAETHQDGIYQCTDTGDTYIFGVKNSGSEGGDEPYYEFDLESEFPNESGTITAETLEKAQKFLENPTKPIYMKGAGVFCIGIGSTNTLDITINLPRFITTSEARLWVIYSTILSINISTQSYTKGDIGVIQFNSGRDGTKYLSDNGSYRTPEFMGRPFRMDVNCTNGAIAGIPMSDNYRNYVVLLDDFDQALGNEVTFQGELSDGCECNAIFKNNGTEEITVTISNTLVGTFVNLTGDVKIPAGKIAELNLLRVGDTYYLRSAVQS